MFEAAILIGVYSYAIFLLGVFGLLYKSYIAIISFFFLVIFILLKKSTISSSLHSIKEYTQAIWRSRFDKFLALLLILQIMINFIGTLGPELGFDALWYHLTLPKIYLQNHSVFFIPGGLLYYSAMPKLIEMLYIPALAFGNEIPAKIIHFLFGTLTLIVLYKISRLFLSRTYSLLVLVIFYSNLVVAWESISAYIDLGRTLYEVMALWAFVIFSLTNKTKWLILSSLMLGFAITSKILAIGSIIIFVSLLILQRKRALHIYMICLLAPLPWLLFAYVSTGNPIYPFFTKTYPIINTLIGIKPTSIIADIWNVSLYSPDPINPVYLIVSLLILFLFKRFTKLEKIIVLYCLIAVFVWFITPRTGGGRFLLPYLPTFSLLVVITVRTIQSKTLKTFLILIVVGTSILTMGYRFIANLKYIPVIIGTQTKQDFLAKNLNFSFGDFYDVDGYFAKKMKPADNVLIYGGHNLYYVNFPFIHESYVKKGDEFNYIITQGEKLPVRFYDWNLVYKNETTHVKLYLKGNKKWKY